MAQAPPRRLSAQRPLKTLFVENPGAGGGRNAPSLDLPSDVHRRQPTNARALVRRVAHRYDRVVCLGGDGTVSAVARGLVESGAQTSLGVVPGGTGNDFAAALGVPEDPEQALCLALSRRARAIDLGAVNGRPFVNAVTMGPAAELSHNTGKLAKAVLGRFAYAFEALRNPGRLQPFEALLIADGKRLEGEFVFIGVANGRRVGGGSHIAPRSVLNDGRLDLVLLPSASARKLAGAIRALRKGDDHPLLVRERIRTLEVTLRTADVAISRDGEPMRGRRLRFEVLRRALRVVVPAASH